MSTLLCDAGTVNKTKNVGNEIAPYPVAPQRENGEVMGRIIMKEKVLILHERVSYYQQKEPQTGYNRDSNYAVVGIRRNGSRSDYGSDALQ